MRYLLLATAFCGAFASSHARASEPPSVECQGLVVNDNARLLPYLSFSTDVTRLPAVAGTPTRHLAAFVGEQGYTRLRLQFVPCRANSVTRRNYTDERRTWVNRLFAGKKVSKLMSVKVDLTAPNVTTIHPIATIGRDSSRRAGEIWSTEVSNTLWLTPYFRVGPTSLARIDVSVSATTDYTSSVSTDVLDLLKRATGLISPSATLLTSLNEDRFNQSASFVDRP